MGDHQSGSQTAPKQYVDKGSVHTPDNVILPCYRLNAPAHVDAPLFVFGHGLKGRLGEHCETHQGSAEDADLQLAMALPPGAPVQPSLVLYDARGHGESTGWQKRGCEQFHWRNLAQDMLQVAAAHRNPGDPPFILGGCSMGAGTAIWAALQNPDDVRGLVLFMAPTIWNTRKERRTFLEARAKEEEGTDPIQAEVSLGAARSDLPEKEELASLAEKQIPVLIVNCRDDPVHPASSAVQLQEALGPQVTLVIVDTRAEINKALADALLEWLPKLSTSAGPRPSSPGRA